MDGNQFISPKIGDYVSLGKYLNQEILWRVIHLDDAKDPLLFSDRIITIKAFDASGDFHATEPRRSNGSNNWLDSNLRQWLNSESTRIRWKQNKPNDENLFQNPYDKECGFLNAKNFSDDERSLLKMTAHRAFIRDSDLEQCFDIKMHHIDKKNIGQYVFAAKVKDRVFCLTHRQIENYLQNSAILGSEYCKAKPTDAASRAITYEPIEAMYCSPYATWPYWLGAADAESEDEVKYMDKAGKVCTTDADNCRVGVRPAVYLKWNSDSFYLEGQGTKSQPYRWLKKSN